jgi:hypothetical protein
MDAGSPDIIVVFHANSLMMMLLKVVRLRPGGGRFALLAPN